jgi:predicted O-linked N-acetylglucosamine transferase (SPINDLY family)
VIVQSLASASVSLANWLRASGRRGEAEQAYQRVIGLWPDNAAAHFNLATLLLEMGRAAESETLLRRALELQPRDAEAAFLLGEVLARLGRHEEALQYYERALKIRPDYIEALNNLSVALKELRRLDDAEQACRRTLQLDPQYAPAHATLGAVLKDLARLAEAADACKRAIEINPRLAQAHLNLGATLHEAGDAIGAEKSYRRALEFDARNAGAHHNLGKLLAQQAKWEQALDCYRRALDLEPDYIEALNNLALTFREMGILEQAEKVCRHGLARHSDSAELHLTFASILKDRGLLVEPEAECREAILLHRSGPAAYTMLALVVAEQGRQGEAAQCYRQVLELNPRAADAHSSLIFSLDLIEEMPLAELQAERRRWDERHAGKASERGAFENARDPDRRLRVGYVSADFRQHSASVIFGPVLARADRSSFEVACYSNSLNEDVTTDRIRAAADQWRRIAYVPDDRVVEMIVADGIDILVDLSGHSGGNRLPVFARKPAPVQVTAWGYATGTGLSTMDYFLADRVLVPPEQRGLFAEEIVDLECCLCYEAPKDLPEVAQPPALSGKPFTFGCYNRLAKISPTVLGLWARILERVPGSRLAIKALASFEGKTRERFLERFAAAGIDPGRLLLLGKSAHLDHLRSYGEVDLGLDPYPHGGGVSTVEALWMGVPVLTLMGETTVTRLSASILTAAGLEQWITRTPEEYVEKAVAMAKDLSALAEARRTLRARMERSPIGDLDRYVRSVEAAYRTMWRRYCA